jgi:replicative DNA helicase Mcm
MELADRLEDFIKTKYYNELQRCIREDRVLAVDFMDLDRFDILISDQLLEDPDNVYRAFDEAAKRVSMEEEKINVRVRNLPDSRFLRIRNIRAKNMGRLWTIDTIIKSASEVKPQIYEAVFECLECGAKMVVPQEGNIVQKPSVCECGRRGDFNMVEKKMFDMRWLVGVEPFELTTGERPGEINIFLKEDLTTPKMQRKTDPGSRLKIVGIIREVPKHIKGKLSTKMDLFVEAKHVETSELEFEELDITPEDEKIIKELAGDPNIYERLKTSIAPGIFGFDEIKESIVLQLFGGVVHKLPDGTRIRGNIHILITGDPGVGKTQMLKLVSSVVPRGKYVSGTGASGAGLTATVVKNEAIGGWVLEAGALILCNKGLIAIDEFDKMNKDDQIAMHEATSVETVSIAKASIVATLPAQTAVLAGANPIRGRFDPYMPIGAQIQIPETLLSRFDLKFALRDQPSRAGDEKLADHIIMSRTNPELIEPSIDLNILRKYIAYAKQINDVELTEEAGLMLKDFYVDMRNRYVGKGAISITLRQYEALLRLAEASAKVRLGRSIEKGDAERAIRLMKASLMQLGYDYETDTFDIDKMDSGITASRRRKMTTMVEIIDELHRQTREIDMQDLKAAAEERGIVEIESVDIIERLKREGTIFEPKPGFIRKV